MQRQPKYPLRSLSASLMVYGTEAITLGNYDTIVATEVFQEVAENLLIKVGTWWRRSWHPAPAVL